MSTESDNVKNRLIMQAIDRMAQFTEPSISAIYGVVDENSGMLVGSGTFIELFGQPYILTAGHVAQEALNYNGLAHSTANGSQPRFISNSWKLLSLPLDIGIVRLDEGAIAGTTRSCIPADRIAENSVGVESDLLFIHGFPGSRSTRRTYFRAMQSTTLPYGAGTSSSAYSWFDDRLHISLCYSPEGMIDGGLSQSLFEEPFGLSGCALWKTNRAGRSGTDWQPEHAKIVGIIFAWDQKAQSLIAIRVEVVRSFLLQFLRAEYAYFRWLEREKPNHDSWSDWFAAVDALPAL